jgi:hypothetical protein
MNFILKLLCLIIISSYDSTGQNLGETTIYNTENSSIIYNEINCLEFDSFGKLWIGTSNGISVFTESTNSWDNFYNQELSDNTLLSNTIQTIESNEESLFIGTIDGVIHISSYSGIPEDAIWNNNYGSSCLTDNNIRSMLWDQSLWIGTTGGLCIENAGPEGTWLMQNTNTGLYSNNITSIKRNTNNNLIAIGTMNGGLVTYDNGFNIYYSSNSNILDNTIWDLAFDQNNNIILCTPQAGLGVFTENESWVWFNTVNSNIPTNSLKKVVVDINNNLWISSLESGLIQYIDNFFYNYNVSNSDIPDNIITALTIGPNNNLWIGTKTNGIVKININESIKNEDLIKQPHLITSTSFKNNISIQTHIIGTLSIFNKIGKLIYTKKLKNHNNNINTEFYMPGLYILSIENSNHIQTQKIIKY